MSETIQQTSNPFIVNAPRTTAIRELRDVQVDVLNTLWQLFPSSKRFKIIAPVGAGKSVIALSIAKYAEKLELHTLISSPLNELVNQYDNSFSEVGLFTLKGRKNYPCMAGRKHAGAGYCRHDECSQGLPVRECRMQNPPQECTVCKCNRCVYPPLIKRFRGSEIANTNFSMFLLGITNNPDVIILDEADMAEDFIRMHYAVTLDSHYDKDFANAIHQLEDYSKALQEQLNIYKSSNIKSDKVDELEEQLGKITYLIDDYQTNHEKWAVTNYISKKSHKAKTKFEPVTTSRFIEPLLENKIVILMSATLPKEGQEVAIEVDSPFNKALHPWMFKPLGKMTSKYRSKTIPKLAILLSKLQNKTVVHCHAYPVAKEIADALLALGIYPYVQVNNDDENEYMEYETVKRYDAVRAFKTCKDRNKILLSVALERGVDFPEPDITNNIVAVVPWDNPTSPLVIAKKAILGEVEYQKDESQRIANSIMQMFGRTNRDNIKQTQTTIIASDFNSTNMYASKQKWFDNNKNLFAKWFLERQATEIPALKKVVVEATI